MNEDGMASFRSRRLQQSGYEPISSGVMAGVIIAGIVILALIIGILILFVLCRRRHWLNKPTNNAAAAERARQAAQDARAAQQSGYGLPVDIPVEALAREPPPRYASVEDLSPPSAHQISFYDGGGGGGGGGGRFNTRMDVSTVSGLAAAIQEDEDDRPPPYFVVFPATDHPQMQSRRGTETGPVAGNERTSGSRSTSAPVVGNPPPVTVQRGRRNMAAPPAYRSQVDLDASRIAVGGRATNEAASRTTAAARGPELTAISGSASVAALVQRRPSIESFTERPNMSEVLLTSSQTALPTSESAAVAADRVAATVAVTSGARRASRTRDDRSHRVTGRRSTVDAAAPTGAVGDVRSVSTAAAAASDRTESRSAHRGQDRARRSAERRRRHSRNGDAALTSANGQPTSSADRPQVDANQIIGQVVQDAAAVSASRDGRIRDVTSPPLPSSSASGEVVSRSNGADAGQRPRHRRAVRLSDVPSASTEARTSAAVVLDLTAAEGEEPGSRRRRHQPDRNHVAETSIPPQQPGRRAMSRSVPHLCSAVDDDEQMSSLPVMNSTSMIRLERTSRGTDV